MSGETAIQWGQPAWTAAMYPRKTGMDHLGLASVSQDRVLRELSPGINVLTVHPRYWSVYTWLLMEFWDRDLPRTNAAWGRFLKPRERIFVAAVMSCPRHGPDIPEVAGKLRVRQEVDRGVGEYDPNAPYLKNTRGGYPIYATAISQLGFIILERDLPQAVCDAPTPLGRQVGTAMREWMSSTAYYESYFDNADQLVPADVVEDYAERVCLCRATDGPDYPYLLDAFMHGGSEVEAARRRASLRLVCDVAGQTKSDPVEPWGFRQFIYYRSDLDGRKYTPSTPELMTTARRWRIYQHRELIAWALNRWLRHTCTWGLANDGDRAPIPIAEALTGAAAVDFTGLASELGVGDPSLAADSPFEDLLVWIRNAAAIDEDLDAEWDITAPACEEHLLDVVWDLNRCDQVSVAAILSLLVACAARMWPLEHQLRYADDWHLVRAGGRRRLAVDRFLEDMRIQVHDHCTIGDTAELLIEHYVMRQHHRTALGKLPDDTFRLRLDVEQVHFVDEPVGMEFNDSRFRALSTCASELGLIKPIGEPAHSLTGRGRAFLNNGDLPTPDFGASAQ